MPNFLLTLITTPSNRSSTMLCSHFLTVKMSSAWRCLPLRTLGAVPLSHSTSPCSRHITTNQTYLLTLRGSTSRMVSRRPLPCLLPLALLRVTRLSISVKASVLLRCPSPLSRLPVAPPLALDLAPSHLVTLTRLAPHQSTRSEVTSRTPARHSTLLPPSLFADSPAPTASEVIRMLPTRLEPPARMLPLCSVSRISTTCPGMSQASSPTWLSAITFRAHPASSLTAPACPICHPLACRRRSWPGLPRHPPPAPCLTSLARRHHPRPHRLPLSL